MTHDKRQVSLLARILVAKHGARAHQMAADRVRQWAHAGDDETAQLWAAVVELIEEHAMMAAESPETHDALEDGDEDLEAIIDETRRDMTVRRQ